MNTIYFHNGTYGIGTASACYFNKPAYNTPVVRMLESVGIENAFRYLKPFNFQKLTSDDLVLPAAIGGFTYGFSPLELTDAYSTFGNNGHYNQNHAITKVTDLGGTVLYKWNTKPKQAWEPMTNDKMRSLLAAAVKEGTEKKPIFLPIILAGKPEPQMVIKICGLLA